MHTQEYHVYVHMIMPEDMRTRTQMHVAQLIIVMPYQCLHSQEEDLSV